MLVSSQIQTDQEGRCFPQYTALSFGGLDLLVNQSEVLSIESCNNIDREYPLSGALGWLTVENAKIPVYSLSDQLAVETTISESKTICAILKDENSCISLLCTDTGSFKQPIVKMLPMPQCMQLVSSPIESLCLCKNKAGPVISFVASPNSLFNYIIQYKH